MSTREQGAASPPIESNDDLVRWIAEGEKPKERWLIGTEHEKFVFDQTTLKPVPYEGPKGIRALMDQMIARYRWEAIEEGGQIIALKRPRGAMQETISLEPGGQFELSGAPLRTLHETSTETSEHLTECLAIGEDLGLGFLGVGFTPTWRLDEIPTMPKARYGVMRRYMPTVGANGLDMMYRTCTIQVNLDFATEADMVQKLRVSLALQPLATALFAASPFREGRATGFKSLRSEVWRDTDRRRTGMLPFAFEPGMGYQRYVDYALDVPMYFVYRDGRYIDAAGASFRDFLDGRLAQLPGERATIDDWADHLTTLFPEVRLKRFLEMRGADSGPYERIVGLPAFWVGLLYDQTALDAAWDLVKDWSEAERQGLRDAVPQTALATPFRGGTLADVAREAMAICRAGLRSRAKLSSLGADETQFIAFAEEIARSGRAPADALLADFDGRWGGKIDNVYKDFAF